MCVYKEVKKNQKKNDNNNYKKKTAVSKTFGQKQNIIKKCKVQVLLNACLPLKM